jgi:hypothetical protein
MGRYFFHLKAHGHLDPDDTGVELLDAEAAFEEAVKAAQDMARDAALGGKDISGQSFEVTDGDGEPVFTFLLSLAIEDDGRRPLHSRARTG